MSTAAEGNRDFRLLDYVALWGSLGATLYLMPFGSLLVPALSIERAVLAAGVAAFVAALLIAAVSWMAARSGQSTLDLLTGVFGQRSATPLGLLLLARHIAFAAFALALIGDVAQLASERALGAGMRPLWVVAFGLVGCALAVAGPHFTVRKVLRRAGIWAVLLVAALVAVSAYLEYEVPAYLKRPASGGWPEFWQAVDIMLIVPLLWLPVVADYGRLARRPGDAALGSFWGMFAATVSFGVLGIIYLPAVASGDIPGFVVGMELGLAALLFLLVLQVDEVFANLQPAATVMDHLPLRFAGGSLVPLAFLAAIFFALPFHLIAAEPWFLLLGSLFVPLFGVLIADQFGPPLPTLRAAAPLAAWASGFLAYQWIAPPDATAWRDAMRWLFGDTLGLPFPLTDHAPWLGAGIAAFLAAFAVQLAVRWMLAALQSLQRPASALD